MEKTMGDQLRRALTHCCDVFVRSPRSPSILKSEWSGTFDDIYLKRSGNDLCLLTVDVAVLQVCLAATTVSMNRKYHFVFCATQSINTNKQ